MRAQFTLSGQNLTVRQVSWDKRFFSFKCLVTNQYGSLSWNYYLNVKGAPLLALLSINTRKIDVCAFL